VRKSAHVVVYATLSALWFRAQRGSRPGWRASWALFALLVSLLVASADEYHQSFDPSRTGTPWDVALDTFAAFLAQAAIAITARRSPQPQA
jgi:VanZ family protein